MNNRHRVLMTMQFLYSAEIRKTGVDKPFVDTLADSTKIT